MPQYNEAEVKEILETYGTMRHAVEKDGISSIRGWYLMNSYEQPMGGLHFRHRNLHIILAEVEHRMWSYVVKICEVKLGTR